ncbi:hypothetical protein [Sphingomonas sp. KR3-1]|uniref:hypothetical protein n=1 Tax=Sphingomonas sp. KR3-1 TaxID=3156611 RepID=UPI0032B4EE28
MLRSMLSFAALAASLPAAAQTGVPEAAPPDAPPAQADAASLAEKAANPISDLISVPFQNNFDCCFGPDGAARYTLNIQPVIPTPLTDSLHLIVRTILPFISEGTSAPGNLGGTGLGDTTQSFFLKPATGGGLTVGLGPVFVYPTGNSDFGSHKWQAGPTGLILKQTPSGYTIGILANHLWSIAGKDDRPNTSNTFLQPFFSKNFKDTTSLGINTETIYDWKRRQWTVPVNLTLGRIARIGRQPVQIAATGKYYAVSPTGGPEWGARLTLTLLFPE